MNDLMESTGRQSPPQTVAAVDLGSNSFHMIVVRDDGGKMHVVDRLKESVRLAAGLTRQCTLDPDACARALDCLARFGQRLGGLSHDHVRAVGTNTLRRALDADAFIADASAALGHPVEVIYGAEEARLIYGGVSQDLGAEFPRRLVVDIGGGSTELIIGQHATPELMESVSLGAVVQTQRFFGDGRITRKKWKAAVTDARLVLEPIARIYREAGWDMAVGASGSIKSILTAAGGQHSDDTITPKSLKALAGAVIKAGRVEKLDLPGLSDDRRPIFVGGLAVLTAVFDSLEIDAMRVSDKALREGVVADLLGRLEDRDVREQGVAAAGRRYDVDRAQGERVAATAIRLLAHLDDQYDDEGGMPARLLRWAALLHEIGLAISHKGYHKHGEYILRNADLQGFARADQLVLATLVRLHRGRFRNDMIDALPAEWRTLGRRLAVVLRAAVIAHRGRDPNNVPQVQLRAVDRELILVCDAEWLEARPLTRADLARESELLARANITLQTTVAESPDTVAQQS